MSISFKMTNRIWRNQCSKKTILRKNNQIMNREKRKIKMFKKMILKFKGMKIQFKAYWNWNQQQKWKLKSKIQARIKNLFQSYLNLKHCNQKKKKKMIKLCPMLQKKKKCLTKTITTKAKINFGSTSNLQPTNS